MGVKFAYLTDNFTHLKKQNSSKQQKEAHTSVADLHGEVPYTLKITSQHKEQIKVTSL
jgi:hypothetical protein